MKDGEEGSWKTKKPRSPSGERGFGNGLGSLKSVQAGKAWPLGWGIILLDALVESRGVAEAKTGSPHGSKDRDALHRRGRDGPEAEWGEVGSDHGKMRGLCPGKMCRQSYFTKEHRFYQTASDFLARHTDNFVPVFKCQPGARCWCGSAAWC